MGRRSYCPIHYKNYFLLSYLKTSVCGDLIELKSMVEDNSVMFILATLRLGANRMNKCDLLMGDGLDSFANVEESGWVWPMIEGARVKIN